MSNVQHSTSQRPDAEALFPVTTESVEETQALGVRLAETLGARAVVALYGDLGAGKTHLVKGIAAGLGLDPTAVRSPTFTILQMHDDGDRPLYHVDAYRVQTPAECRELGFEKYVHGPGLTCIEWADRVESLLPPHTLHLTLEHVAQHKRRIALSRPHESAPSDS
jgi:tRNA threonylcarbamoyladenosine biosynthesis protein TsaE